ncbi:hypothetical protein BpHYR1_014954 [Brachionus plicatilis]|uniref:Uncharacterized protein n=1 Tax=Brachionus plicatilis TaxID=10195 RepID=A0A3M7Q090_BRAPC|nr:hypothetical protein BpHYR1_014954 [Brachionus plicatilis]
MSIDSKTYKFFYFCNFDCKAQCATIGDLLGGRFRKLARKDEIFEIEKHFFYNFRVYAGNELSKHAS